VLLLDDRVVVVLLGARDVGEGHVMRVRSELSHNCSFACTLFIIVGKQYNSRRGVTRLEPGRTMTLRWGLIGSGDIVRKRVAPALRDLKQSELVGVCRGRADLAEAFAKEFGARKWYPDVATLVADPEIDAVYVATPVDLHAEHTIAAAKAGKHVLCEKPMAMNVKECDAMIEACRGEWCRARHRLLPSHVSGDRCHQAHHRIR
jgi:hypothetical protein